MISLDKEFKQWLSENQNLYEHLKHHDSVLYTRFMPVFEVLLYFYENELQNPESMDDDVVKIFQVGFEYLHSQISVIKIYQDKIFHGDLHALLHYDSVINYILYIEDLQYELHENKVKFNKKELDELPQYLEDIIVYKKEVPDNLSIYIDSKINKILGNKDYEFTSIIDIFVEIASTLEIDLYNEDEYVIGKEI